MANKMKESGNSERKQRKFILFSWAPKITAGSDYRDEIKRPWLCGRKANKPRQHIKKKRHHFAKKCPYSQSYSFSSSHVWTWEVDHKEGWALKSWCFQTVVLEKTLESLLDSKEIKSINPKGNQQWIFTGRTDAEVPILWLADVKPDLKTLMLGEIEGKREKNGAAEDEMII